MSNRRVTMDPVVELRLRQWARRNYVAPECRRDSDWHEVVLDEMRRKDRELQAEDRRLKQMESNSFVLPTDPRQPYVVMSAGIVPLAPSLHEGVRIDAAHSAVKRPSARLLSAANGESVTESAPYYA